MRFADFPVSKENAVKRMVISDTMGSYTHLVKGFIKEISDKKTKEIANKPNLLK